MSTENFWNYVRSFKGEASLKDVFARYSSETELGTLEERVLWACVNRDVEDLFVRSADTIIKPDGTIVVESPDTGSHRTNGEEIQDSTLDNKTPESTLSHTTEPNTGDTETNIDSDLPNLSPNSGNSPDLVQKSESNKSTIFNRLNEKN